MSCQGQKNSQTKVKVRNCSEELLTEVYKNVSSVKEDVLCILAKVKNEELSRELTTELGEYSCFCEKISVQVDRCGGETKPTSVVSKMTAKIGAEINTIADSTDQHLAQVIIETTTMAITDIIRAVRDYENSNCSETALTLARAVVSYQEKAIEKLKAFL